MFEVPIVLICWRTFAQAFCTVVDARALAIALSTLPRARTIVRDRGHHLNRWGHACVNPQPGFFFGINDKPAPRVILRNQPHGRIAFANTDLAGASDHCDSIREADRAVKQII